MTVWVLAGPAGSGKSTLGRALATRCGAVLLDLDTVTNPLLDSLGSVLAPGGHWNDPARRHDLRPARYATLLAVAADQVADEIVLVAPFTAELRGGEEWARLLAALSPAVPRVVWLDGSPALYEARRTARGEPRDQFPVVPHPEPMVPHVRIDAAAPTSLQLAALLPPDSPAASGVEP
jgi:sugar-phosphatase